MQSKNLSAVGALFSAGAAMTATFGGVAAKLSSVSPMLIGALSVGLGSLLVLVLLVSLQRVNPISSDLPRRIGLLLLLTGGLYAAISGLFLAAYRFLAVGNAAILVATAPVWTPFIACFTLGERPSWRTVLAIALTVVGCALAARPEFIFGGAEQPPGGTDTQDYTRPILGWLCGIGSALTLACLYTAMRRFKDESSLVVIFYASLIGGVLLGVLAAVTWPSEGDVVQAVLDDPWPFAIAVGMGNFLPNFLGMVGATFADASVQAVAGQSAVVFAFLMEIFWFDNVPLWSSVVGACLIVASVALVALEDACAACMTRRAVGDVSESSNTKLNASLGRSTATITTIT